MPDTKITALAAITTVDPAADVLPIVDISDTSMAASGTTKKITSNQILGAGGTATLASATITGALTAQGTQVKLSNQAAADCTVLIGPDTPSSTRSGRIGFITSSTEKNWFIANNWNVPGGFEITQSTAAGGSTMSSNPTFRINNNSDFLFLDGAGGTRMTLNSTGLGVGRTPSTYKFEVSGNAQIIQTNFLDVALRISQGPATTGNKSQVIFTDSTGTLSYITGYGSAVGAGLDGMLALGVGGSDRVLISTTGNLGIGVLPSAWGAGYTALQNRQTCWFSTSARDLNLGANVYVDAVGYKYIATSQATLYTSYQGAHSWYNAPSGTAGNAITFTQAMTLDASGNLLVGTTSSPSGTKVGAIAKLSGVSAEGTAAINVSTTPVAISRNTGVCGLFFVMGYNASGGAQGWYLVASTGSGTPTVISSGGTPGLTLTFTMAGGQLNAQTASGTFVANAFSITA